MQPLAFPTPATPSAACRVSRIPSPGSDAPRVRDGALAVMKHSLVPAPGRKEDSLTCMIRLVGYNYQVIYLRWGQ